MNQHQSQVAEFHKALDIPIGDTPELRRKDLRMGVIAEEYIELCEAVDNDDLVEAIDALGDLLYVIYGAALEWGVDLEPFFQEIHRTNMNKVGGPTRADGKKLKPEGWQPPNIAGILREQIAASTMQQRQGTFDSIIGRGASAALGG